MENKPESTEAQAALLVNSNDSLSVIMDKAGPLIKYWHEGEAKKATIESAVEKEYINKEYLFKRLIIRVLAGGMFLMFCLCAYLFYVNKDNVASNILTITLTGVISFLGGFGVGKSLNSSD